MLLLLLQIAAAHPPAPANDTLAAKVDRIFAEWNKPGSPGCALGIVRDGSMLYRKGYGVQSLATRLPLTTASVFYAASVSKQFAAASVVLAARDGRLSLDDEVQKWVPELPAYGKPITVGHLIHHTSGLRDYLTMWGLSATLGAVHSDSDLVGLLGRQRSLNFDPGAEFSYSNSGYVLLSYIISGLRASPCGSSPRSGSSAPWACGTPISTTIARSGTTPRPRRWATRRTRRAPSGPACCLTSTR